MERAQAIWRELGLPDLQLKSPYFGYNLRSWSPEDEEDADRAVAGKHYVTGTLREGLRSALQAGRKK